MIPLIPNPLDTIGNAAGQVVENWLVDLAGSTGKSAQIFLEKSATFWVTGVKSPQLTYATEQNAYAPASTVGFLWTHLHFYVAALAIFSVLFAAGKMAWQRNGAPARELLQSLLTLVVVSSAGVAVISLMTTASDEAASYILSDAMKTPDGKPTTFQVAFGQMFAMPTPTNPTAVLLILLFGLVILSTFVQIALLLIRGGMLFLLAGTLPLAASATNTETGRQWFRKSLAWTIAFILYKPTAAIVYATAFQLTREGSTAVQAGALAPAAGDQMMKVVTGLVMCLLAIFALPALMRFTTPAVAAATGGGGGGVAALGGALGMGAKAALGRSGGSSGGGKGGGGGGPKGNSSQKKSDSSGGSGGGGPQGNSQPAGKAAGQGATSTKAGAAAGPVGATAAAVTEGLKKTQQATNAAVSNAAGEESPGASSPSKQSPGKGGAKPPTGGQTPQQQGPSGGNNNKPPPSPPSNPPSNPPTTGGPSGGKRK